jgi:hypothetical protein
MAKDRNTQADKGITKVTPPSWLSYADEDTSLATLQPHVIVPRCKVIQAMSEDGLKKQFGEGTCVIRPGDSVLAALGETFFFCPLFFFVEFCKWSDRRDTTNPMIIARTFDPTSDIARRAQSSELRLEIYPEDAKVKAAAQRQFRYVEHLNFVGVVYGEHDLAGTEVTVSFARGEHGQGRNFITAITLRRQEVQTQDGATARIPVPLWAQVWGMTPALRDRKDQKWYGLDFHPGVPPTISSERVDAHRTRYLELKDAYDQRRLTVDGDDRTEETTSTDGQF